MERRRTRARAGESEGRGRGQRTRTRESGGLGRARSGGEGLGPRLGERTRARAGESEERRTRARSGENGDACRCQSSSRPPTSGKRLNESAGVEQRSRSSSRRWCRSPVYRSRRASSAAHSPLSVMRGSAPLSSQACRRVESTDLLSPPTTGGGSLQSFLHCSLLFPAHPSILRLPLSHLQRSPLMARPTLARCLSHP